MRSTAQITPVEIFIEDPVEDTWVIPSGLKTEWTLSRFLPWPTVSEAIYPPRAFVADHPSAIDEEELSVEFGALAAGDLAHDSADVTRVKTVDLTAHAGRLLVFRYHPLRLVAVESVSQVIEVANGLDFSVSFTEYVPSRGHLWLEIPRFFSGICCPESVRANSKKNRVFSAERTLVCRPTV